MQKIVLKKVQYVTNSWVPFYNIKINVYIIKQLVETEKENTKTDNDNLNPPPDENKPMDESKVKGTCISFETVSKKYLMLHKYRIISY